MLLKICVITFLLKSQDIFTTGQWEKEWPDHNMMKIYPPKSMKKNLNKTNWNKRKISFYKFKRLIKQIKLVKARKKYCKKICFDLLKNVQMLSLRLVIKSNQYLELPLQCTRTPPWCQNSFSSCSTPLWCILYPTKPTLSKKWTTFGYNTTSCYQLSVPKQ